MVNGRTLIKYFIVDIELNNIYVLKFNMFLLLKMIEYYI